MSGDLSIKERLIILPEAQADARPASANTNEHRRVVHMYGARVMIMEDQVEAEAVSLRTLEPSSDVLGELSPEERLGYEAFALRESADYQSVKEARPHQGEPWDSGSHEMHCTPPGEALGRAAAAESFAGAPTSQRLTGSVAVGIIIVEGPTATLKFSAAERTTVVAEVQNGLGWLATQNPEGVVFKYDIKVVTLSVQPGPSNLSFEEKERRWRDPAMQQLGYGTGMAAVTAHAEKIRQTLGTNWTYVAFFTKYPLGHFAYASIGGPRLVMDYANDGWGVSNIDRVFAHETGHIFGAPDEYASSGCNCGGSWGFYGRANANCANCAPGGGVDCIMKGNTWNMCVHTPYHLGFPLVQQTYAGVWRQGGGAHHLWVNASWSSFHSKWTQLAQQNLRLVDLKITRDGGAERFHGVWRQGTGGYYLWVNASQANFVAKWQQLSAQGLRLVDIEVQNVGGTLLYSGVWLPGNDAHYLWINADWNSFSNKWQQLTNQGLRLHDIKIVNVGGSQRFFGIWRQGTGGHYLWVNADWTNFRNKWQQLAGQNLRLVDLEITQTAQGTRYSGVWLPGSDGYYLWVGADWQNFQAKWQEVSAQGLRLIDLDVVPASGAQSPTLESSVGFGGLAAEAALAEEEDGMGGGGEAALEGDGGYGMGSLDGTQLAPLGGLAGEGGGSIGAPVEVAEPELQTAGPSEPPVTGGGALPRADGEAGVEPELEGIGGGLTG